MFPGFKPKNRWSTFRISTPHFIFLYIYIKVGKVALLQREVAGAGRQLCLPLYIGIIFFMLKVPGRLVMFKTPGQLDQGSRDFPHIKYKLYIYIYLLGPVSKFFPVLHFACSIYSCQSTLLKFLVLPLTNTLSTD